ncbi:MAG: redoxin domain-containing protein [Planctomycetes bacterium]|nr:redoxin domain-containing protein [Planctomycetota bacterium]
MQNDLEKRAVRCLPFAPTRSPDNSVKEENDLRFDILSDTDTQIIRAYGLLFREPMRDIDIALPANFLIDRDGKIAWQWIASRVQDRADPALVSEEVAKLVGGM